MGFEMWRWQRVLAELLDLLDLTGELRGEGLLEALQLMD